MAKAKTPNTGAAITRAAVIRKIKQLRESAFFTPSQKLDELEKFVRTHAKRTSKRKGGLGRK